MISLDAQPRCPVLSPDGLPCQKRIWPGEEEHGGGHLWASDEVMATIDSGHFDATKLISGQPAPFHAAEDCPGPPECFADRLTATLKDVGP